MSPPNSWTDANIDRKVVDLAIKLALVFLVLLWCLQILLPFLSVTVWGAVIAIAVYKPYLRLRRAVGGRQKLAVTLVVLLGLAIIVVPFWSLTDSLVESAMKLGDRAAADTLSVPPPPETVREWPLVGKKIYAGWTQASDNLSAFLTKNAEQVKAIGTAVLGKVAGAGLGVLQFMVSILIAGVLLASAQPASQAMQRLAVRLAGKRGDSMLTLSVSTIRSVAVGVLGIALIQSILAGIGMVFADVPAAGIWAALVLVLAIAQLPPILVLLPIVFYVFSEQSTTVAVIFAIWSVAVSLSDAFLKPLLLGRGVEAPMLVILLGAIGGMIVSGIIGLFVGAVVLAVGYQLFQVWLTLGSEQAESTGSDATPEIPGPAESSA